MHSDRLIETVLKHVGSLENGIEASAEALRRDRQTAMVCFFGTTWQGLAAQFLGISMQNAISLGQKMLGLLADSNKDLPSLLI